MFKKYCTILTKLFLASSLFLISAAAHADRVTTFVLDPTHSQVRFQWDHLGFSNPGANFDLVAGEIHVNETRLDRSTVDISIIVESLHTHVPALDRLLLTDTHYFQPQEHPLITYVSTAITNLDLEDKSFDLEGALSINGIQQPITLAAQINKVGPHPLWDDAQAIGVTASTELLRSDFGMDAHVPLVSDTISVSINLEAIESKGYDKALFEREAAKQAEANEQEEEHNDPRLASRLAKHLNKDSEQEDANEVSTTNAEEALDADTEDSHAEQL